MKEFSLKLGNLPMFNRFMNKIVSRPNYRPIFILPVCGKILKKFVFDVLYSFMNNNNLISKDQSGFRPGDSTINQLISITSSIFESFENFEETRALFQSETKWGIWSALNIFKTLSL